MPCGIFACWPGSAVCARTENANRVSKRPIDCVASEEGCAMPDGKLISADSHFVEPPKMWAERLDRKFRDRAPHAVKLEGKSGEYFVCVDLAPAPIAAFFSAGVPP